MFATGVALRQEMGEMPVVGITGSYGKTTTKELLAYGLAEQYSLVKNHASYNIIDGIHSTLSRVTPETELIIQELGASRPGSLETLIVMSLPTIGVITAIGDDHWSAFKSREAIRNEKFKLIEALPASGTAVLNRDDPMLVECLEDVPCRLITFGVHSEADVQIQDVSSSWPDRLSCSILIDGRAHSVTTRFVGAQFLTAVGAAIAAACALGADIEAFIQRLAGFQPVHGRMGPITRADGLTLIMDHYKASRYMLDEMLDFMAGSRCERRYLIVGWLSESPRNTGRLYRAVAKQCREQDVVMLTIGEQQRQYLRRQYFGVEDDLGVFEDAVALSEWLSEHCRPEDLIVVKSGALWHLERLIVGAATDVRCRALACGHSRTCGRCERLSVDTPPDYSMRRSASV